MKKVLFFLALIAIPAMIFAQSLTIQNLTNCTLYVTLDAMALSTGDAACSIQTNQIVLGPSSSVSYANAVLMETGVGWAIAGSTAPYAINGIPSDFIYTDIVFNSVCSCANWINGYMGNGPANCFGTASQTFVGQSPPGCVVFGSWNYLNMNYLFINFHN